jgi:hypothetical protein
MITPESNMLPAHPWDDVPVLRYYTLRDGFELERTSRFRDDEWYFAPAVHQPHQRSHKIKFASVPERYRLTAKEICCAALAMPLPAGEARPALTSMRAWFSQLLVFFNWLDAQPGTPALADLTGQDMLRFARYVQEKSRHPHSAAGRRAAVRKIWLFRAHLPADRLMFDPLRIDGWSTPHQRSRPENATERIPEQVFGPLVIWAMRFVDILAPDLLAMAKEWAVLRANHDAIPKTHGQRRPDLAGRLEELLAWHLEHGRPLPGRKGVINFSFLSKNLVCSRSSLDRTAAYLARLEQVAAVVGIDDETYFYTPTTGRLEGRIWLEKISNEYGDRSLPVLARHLQTASYVLVSFFSGMRDGEIKSLRRGCLHVLRDGDGNAYRWKLRGRAFKGESDHTGVEATWVVGEPAARAVQVLEALQPPECDLLFQVLPYGVGWAEAHVGRALVTNGTNCWLNRFVTWVNDYCATHGCSSTIPDVNGKPFRLSTSQFRRTLAWFIARKPGGAIAGAIQYRHMSIQMFEGYAGTSESGFRAEVEGEQALARGEHLIEIIDAHQHKELSGPSAEEAVRRLEEFGLHTDGFAGSVITDERRLRRLMKRHDPAIYPGTYTTCVYQYEKAISRHRVDSQGNPAPDLGDCKPLLCQNVVLTLENRQAWMAELERIDQRLTSRPRLPPLLEHQLTRRRDEIASFLDRHAISRDRM